MSEDRGLARRAAPLLIGVALVVAAIVPRLGPALGAYQPSNDAAEHLLIARSLARGEGFTLPIRVRDVEGGPVVHDAYGERAPLFPWLLSIPVRAGVGAEGWPDPRLQLVGVVLAALCAPLAASVAWMLARRRGLGGWRAGWAAVGAGLVVAWMPSLVRASVHLWAEPLGLLLVLVVVRLELALGEGGRSRLRPYEDERERAGEDGRSRLRPYEDERERAGEDGRSRLRPYEDERERAGDDERERADEGGLRSDEDERERAGDDGRSRLRPDEDERERAGDDERERADEGGLRPDEDERERAGEGGRSRLRPYEDERERAGEYGRSRLRPDEEECEPAGELPGVAARHAAPGPQDVGHGEGGEGGRRSGGAILVFVLGCVGGLARFARPEAWVVVALLVGAALWRARRGERRWRELGALLAGLILVNGVGIAITGVVAPQLFLLEVRRFEEAMGAGAAPARPGVIEVIAAVAANVAGQAWFLLQPKNAWFVVPLAALALGRSARRAVGERWLVAWALAFVAATAGVWSTSDPHRFTITPLGLLAPAALVEAQVWTRRMWPGRRWPLAVVMGTLVLIVGHAAGREMRGRGPEPVPVVAAQEGVVVTSDPWSYALITGRPAVLARQAPADGQR